MRRILRGKERVEFIAYRYLQEDDTFTTIFKFYPKGTWDEYKWSIEEAIKKYPPKEYNWIIKEDNGG